VWSVLLKVGGVIGFLGVFGIAFMVARNWQGKLKAAVAHREHLEQLAAGGSAGASASAVSSGNVVNIIDKQLVLGSGDDVGVLGVHNGESGPHRSTHLWVPRPVLPRSPSRHVVGEAEVDVVERSSIRKRLEYLRAAVARGDDTDAVGIDHRRSVVGESDYEGG
jgi:hypothetical protein